MLTTPPAIVEAARERQQVPGIAIAIVRDAQLVETHGFGSRGCNGGPPPDERTRFAVASLTKQFVAVLALQAVEHGTMSLDTRVDAVFPQARGLHEVTLRELLQQRSGVADYNTPQFALSHVSAFLPPSHRSIVTALFREAPHFQPGSRFEYSNANYYLVGAMLERTVGHSIEEQLQREIVTPLQLHDTYFGTPHGDDAAAACAVLPWDIGAVAPFDESLTWTAGGITSSVGDLARFESALLRGDLLKPPELRLLFTPGGGRAPDALGDYGASWFVYTAGGRVALWHDGTVLGYKSAIVAEPRARNAAIVLGNADYLRAAPLAFAVADVAFALPAGAERNGIDPNRPTISYTIAILSALAVLGTCLIRKCRRWSALFCALIAYVTVAVVWWAPPFLAAVMASLLVFAGRRRQF